MKQMKENTSHSNCHIRSQDWIRINFYFCFEEGGGGGSRVAYENPQKFQTYLINGLFRRTDALSFSEGFEMKHLSNAPELKVSTKTVIAIES